MIASSRNFSAAEVQRASHSLSSGELSALRAPMQHTLDVLERVREVLGVPVKIESFARSAAHNKNVGGVETSDHLVGYAADIIALGGMKNAEAFDKLAPHVAALGIDQLIYDPNDGSLHVGTGPKQRARAWVESSSKVDDVLARLFGPHISVAQKLAASGVTVVALLLAAVLVFTSEKGGSRG